MTIIAIALVVSSISTIILFALLRASARKGNLASRREDLLHRRWIAYREVEMEERREADAVAYCQKYNWDHETSDHLAVVRKDLAKARDHLFSLEEELASLR